MKNLPVISIVTVSYNAVATIEKTILSVINQTYPNIEYIIIDGGSTDGTVDIIKKYEDKIAYWVSEPDKGIYDAMNKGIRVATGEWINFMNCGDSFYQHNVIYEVFQRKIQGDVVYGDTHIIEKWGAIVEKPMDLDCMKEITPFCHQSSFVKLERMKMQEFNLKYSICADRDFFYKLWKQQVSFSYVPIVISSFDKSIGSLSGDSPVQMMKENLLISSSEGWLVTLKLNIKIIRLLMSNFFAFFFRTK